MAPRKKKPVPFFVFLDENIAGLDEEIAQVFSQGHDPENFSLCIFPFPKSKKGKKDWEIVLYLKQAVFSPRYPIRALLDDSPTPVVVFLTLDLDFVEDAQRGFNKSDKKWHLHEQVMQFAGDRILFFKDEHWTVTVSILTVPYTEKDKKQGLPEVLARALNKFLSAQ